MKVDVNNIVYPGGKQNFEFDVPGMDLDYNEFEHMIKNGDMVTIMASSGALRVSMSGIAKQNGKPISKEQARDNAIKIATVLDMSKPFKFFSSPLGRAKESAFIIAKTLGIDKNKIIFDSNVQEVNYGIFEGEKKEFCQTHYKKEFEEREANKWFYVLEGGESYDMVTKRLHLWLEEIKDEAVVILVAHEMINRALRGIYCNYEKQFVLQLRQKNDVVFKLENFKEFIVE